MKREDFCGGEGLGSCWPKKYLLVTALLFERNSDYLSVSGLQRQ